MSEPAQPGLEPDIEDGETVVVDRSGETVDEGETVVVDRSAEVPDAGETVVVDRSVGVPDAGDTVIVDRSTGQADVSETVVVDRSPEPPAADGETVVVERSGGAVDAEHTVLVDRAARRRAARDPQSSDGEPVADTILPGPDADTILPNFDADTVIGSRAGFDDDDAGEAGGDSTVVVAGRGERARGGTASETFDDVPADALDGPGTESGSGPSGPAGASGRFGTSSSGGASTGMSGLVDSPATPRRRLGGRRTLQLAPLEPIDLRSSVRAVGAGAIESYRPRALPTATEAPKVETDPTPPREPSHALPSIAKRSRRGAVTAILTVVVCVIVGIAGAVTVAGLLLAG